MTDRNLPPRELWPELVQRVPGAVYPDALNVADVLLTGASARRDAVAIVHRDRRVTVGALDARVRSIAAALIRFGVRPGDRVAFRLPNSPEFIAVWLAIQWVGAVGVAIPPPYRRREIAHIVNDSGAVLLLCTDELSADVQAASRAFAYEVRVVVTASGAPESAGCGTPPPFPTSAKAPALITYVSSADGVAKGAVQSPATILAPADTYARDVLRLTDADVCAGSVSMALAFGLGALLVFPLRARSTVVLLDPSMPWTHAMASERITVFYGVPTLYRILLQQLDMGAHCGRLRCCVSAAEPLPRDLADEWRERTGVDLVDGLGTTELSHIFVSARPGSVRPGRFGTPVPGYEARLVDEAFDDVPDGVEGRLAVRGPTGCLYWRNPAAQARAVRGGWSLTNDVCVRHPDGQFEHVRRVDGLIVSGGFKVSPRKVQLTLEEHPAVASARVYAVVDRVRGTAVAADVVPSGPQGPGFAELLQQYVKSELAPFKCPRIVKVLQPAAVAT